MQTPPTPGALERVAFDSSVLLGPDRRQLVAAAAVGYCRGFWSTWIVSEVVRRRTEWISERAVREGAGRAELRRRLRESRERVNRQVANLSRVLTSVDYMNAPAADLSWLKDRDDWPVMQTALAAQADTLVTDNTLDFPSGEVRDGVSFLTGPDFLRMLYVKFSTAESDVRRLLRDAEG